MNPLKAEILARCANRTKVAESGDLASDQHVDRRRWLLIDVDPVRIAGISATNDEKAAALDVADAVGRYLDGLGWPAPIKADSGNGWHLFYGLDLPADDGGLIQRCLAALAQRFDTEAAKVDRSVFNPARIVKIPGTMARKGDATQDRPHRRGGIVTTPTAILPTPVALLEALAAEVAPKVSATVPATPPASATSASPSVRNGKAARKHRLDVARWLSDRGVAFKVKDTKDSRGRMVYALDACPFSRDGTLPFCRETTASWPFTVFTSLARATAGKNVKKRSASRTTTTGTHRCHRRRMTGRKKTAVPTPFN